MKIKWYDASVCAPVLDGQYMVIMDSGKVDTADYSDRSWWTFGVLFWARLPGIDEIQDEVDTDPMM